MVRPSRRATLNVSFVTFTSATRSSAASAKMPMPSLQECRLMLHHPLLKPPQLFGREAEVPCEADRLQPELGRQIVPIDMDMRRLLGFMVVEVKAVRAAAQDGRHGTPARVVFPFLRLTGRWPNSGRGGLSPSGKLTGLNLGRSCQASALPNRYSNPQASSAGNNVNDK